MAQYNLVGYNSAPTNPEYSQMVSAMDKTPRTNWAEYSLKKEQLKEQKKQNRIKNALNIVNTIATGVNTYENVLNSELERKTRTLQNQELSLDIQSKTIDVNKKSEEAQKDLDFATKIREIQESKDWSRASELLSDPETAIRNKNLTKTLIEQLRFNGFKDGADNLYTSLFPDEKYQRDQDALKLQTQKDIAYAQIGAANARAAASRAQSERHFQIDQAAKMERFNLRYGKGGIDAAAINKDFLTKVDKAYTAFMNTPPLSSFAEDNNFDFPQTLKDPNSDIDYTVTDTNEIKQLLRTRSDLEREGKLDTFPADSQAKLESVLGKNFDKNDNDNEELLEKNQLLEIFYNGQSHYKLVDRQTSKDILAARNANIKRQGLLVLNELDNSTLGDISSFGSGKLYALAELPSTTLKGELDKFPRLLESATPQQRQTKAFKKLEAAVQRVSSQTPTITDTPQTMSEDTEQKMPALKDVFNNLDGEENPDKLRLGISNIVNSLRQTDPANFNQFVLKGLKLSGRSQIDANSSEEEKQEILSGLSDEQKINYANIGAREYFNTGKYARGVERAKDWKKDFSKTISDRNIADDLRSIIDESIYSNASIESRLKKYNKIRDKEIDALAERRTDLPEKKQKQWAEEAKANTRSREVVAMFNYLENYFNTTGDTLRAKYTMGIGGVTGREYPIDSMDSLYNFLRFNRPELSQTTKATTRKEGEEYVEYSKRNARAFAEHKAPDVYVAILADLVQQAIKKQQETRQ